MIRAFNRFIVGIVAFILLCEVLFRILPVSSATRVGYYIDDNIPTYAPLLDWHYSTGWDLRNAQALHTNNFGFVSAHDFTRDSNAVPLIGDSYAEGASLAEADRLESQLEKALSPHRAVFAMGFGGTSLLDYAGRIRFASQHFGSRDFVVLMERGDVRQAFCGSGNANSQCLDPATLAPVTVTLAAPSLLKRVLRQSAFAQYLTSQLKIDPAQLLRLAFRHAAAPAAPGLPGKPSPAPVPALRDVDVVAAAFFERVKPYVAGRLVIVLDSDRDALMRGLPIDDPERRHFIELARAAGAVVIDTEPLFREHFRHSSLSLALSPVDGHYNPLAVHLVSLAAARALDHDAPNIGGSP